MPPADSAPGSWIKACIVEQELLAEDAVRREEWNSRTFTVFSKLCPGRSFVIPMEILRKEICISCADTERSLRHTDGIAVDPETGIVTVSVATPSGVKQIQWARLDIIKDRVRALPAHCCAPPAPPSKGLKGVFEAIENLGAPGGLPPDTTQLFKFDYEQRVKIPKEQPYDYEMITESLSTQSGYIDPESGYLQPDPQLTIDFRLEPRIVIEGDSVRVVWMDRRLRPWLPT